MTGQPAEPTRVQKALVELSGTLDKLEDMFLKRQPFLCGDDISLADLLAVCEIMQVSRPQMISRMDTVGWIRLYQSFLCTEFLFGAPQELCMV